MSNSSNNILSRLGTRFSNATGERDKPDYLTRDIGGHFRNNQPYISGYFQIVMGLPLELFGGSENSKVASQWLHSTCESFQPHTQTLNKVDLQGQGQIGSSYVASVSTTREITLAFREYQNMPILNIIKRWAAIMDPFTGVSPLDGNRFIPANYKGWLAVAQTKPVGAEDRVITADDLEECYIYQGVFPTNIPLDTASAADQTANDLVQLSSTWSFDGAPMTSAEPETTTKVVELLNNMQYIGSAGGNDNSSTYKRYWETATGDKTSQWGSHEDNTSTIVDPDGGGSSGTPTY